MLRIDNLKTAPGADEAALRRLASAALRVPEGELHDFRVLRRSIDARGDEPRLVWSVAAAVKNESAVLKRCRSRNVSRLVEEAYELPDRVSAPAARPVVVGAGPAGLFCALVLASCGAPPVLLERGKCVEERKRDVERFWSSGTLDAESNVQFGEGGAGAFSDGKLNTGTRDLRHRWILERFVEFGAHSDILIDAKPHVGTDRLYVVLQNLRRRLVELGADVRFCNRLEGIETDGGAIGALRVASPEGEYMLSARQVALAPGHSARDTFKMLRGLGVPMEPKAFAVGVRIEHSQCAIDASQYGAAARGLPPSSYKLAYHTREGRGVFSFCVCPGGYVVASASEPGRLVTNGMSELARDGQNINGALLVSVTPEDFGGTPGDPLAGVEFQRRLEEAAFRAGGGDYTAPAQLVGDFLARRASKGPLTVTPSYRPAVRWTELRGCLPDFVCDAMAEALPELDKKLCGYAEADAVLTAVESRSSSPVRLLRDAGFRSGLRGLYPCGEGAGY
ncbi:MAG: hypothetical protein J5449_01695, partial [Oscillospiraceae bacterium]|nr:hypothetical protein [Oscillospiraceae bacterium]